MWIGNVMLLVLNLPLVGWWARLVRVPYRFLYPTTVALSCTGIYALNHSTFDLWLAAIFGVVPVEDSGLRVGPAAARVRAQSADS
jgi:putative tricarboxylic transport membrane protein